MMAYYYNTTHESIVADPTGSRGCPTLTNDEVMVVVVAVVMVVVAVVMVVLVMVVMVVVVVVMVKSGVYGGGDMTTAASKSLVAEVANNVIVRVVAMAGCGWLWLWLVCGRGWLWS